MAINTTNKATVLRLQMLYAGLCIVWNAVVITQNALGMQPIGPTGSWIVILVAALFILLLWQFHSRALWWPYILLSLIIGMLALSAVTTGLTSRASLWPSWWWQAAGLGINILGVLSALAAVWLGVKSVRSN